MSGCTAGRHLRICGAIVIASATLSCNRTTLPTSPGSPQVPGAQVSTVRLEVAAPASLAPGANAALKASAVLYDGSVKDVTDQTTFSSGNVTVLQVVASVMSGVGVGEARVNATYQAPEGTRYGSAVVDVLIPGTFKLHGRVADAGIPVPDALLAVRSGIGEGLTARTQRDGTYVLFGVAGRVRLELRRQGYMDAVVDLDVNQSATHDVTMIPDRARAIIAGAYTLAIDMGPCDGASEAMPTELRRRRYGADVAQENAQLTVTLRGGEFFANRFTGAIDPLGRVTFMIGDPSDDYLIGPFDVMERVGPTDVFVAYGAVEGSLTESGLRGSLNGYLMVTDVNHPTYFSASATCRSSAHVFELRRQ